MIYAALKVRYAQAIEKSLHWKLGIKTGRWARKWANWMGRSLSSRQLRLEWLWLQRNFSREKAQKSSLLGRRKDKLKEAVKAIGDNATGVQGDASNLADLDRLREAVEKRRLKIDILFASAGFGEFAKIGEVTEEHFDKTSAQMSAAPSSRCKNCFPIQ